MRVGRAALVAIVAIGVALIATAGRPAYAHAVLLEVSPGNSEIVATAPEQVVLVFSEQVSLVGGSARVLNDDAEQVSGEPVVAGDTVTVPLVDAIPDGTYTLTFVVVSTDSHRVGGASVFHVGAATSEGLVGHLPAAGDETGWAIRAGAVALTGVGYAGALIAGGVVALAAVTAFRRPTDDDESDAVARRWDALAIRAAVLGAVATLAAVPLRIARLGGGLDALRDNDVIRAHLGGAVGQSTAVVAVGLLAVAAAVDRRARAWVTLPLCVVALTGFALEGHTRGQREAMMIAADVGHLAAASVWIGGIAALLVVFRTPAAADRLALIVGRFSVIAVAAVPAVALFGVAMALLIAPDAGAFTGTGWGLALIVKVALVVAVVAVGAYNNRVLVPRIKAGDGPRLLLRTVIAEATVLLAVIGVAAVLVTRSPVGAGTPPPSGPVAGPAIEDDRAATVRITLSDGGSAEVALSPGAAGPNAVEVIVRDAGGRVVRPVEVPVLSFTHPELDIGPLQPELAPRYVGHYTGEVDLSFAGEWEISLRVRVGDFESVAGSAALTLAE